MSGAGLAPAPLPRPAVLQRQPYHLPICTSLLTYCRAAMPLQPGQRCVCVEDGLPTWVCELMAVKPTVHEAITFIKHIEASMELPITPHKKS